MKLVVSHFTFFCIEEFNLHHKTQWKSNLSPFQYNSFHSYSSAKLKTRSERKFEEMHWL